GLPHHRGAAIMGEVSAAVRAGAARPGARRGGTRRASATASGAAASPPGRGRAPPPGGPAPPGAGPARPPPPRPRCPPPPCRALGRPLRGLGECYRDRWSALLCPRVARSLAQGHIAPGSAAADAVLDVQPELPAAHVWHGCNTAFGAALPVAAGTRDRATGRR